MSRDLGEGITTISSELTNFTWRINPFHSIMNAELKPTIEFDAGQSIGLPSKWKWGLEKRTTYVYGESGPIPKTGIYLSVNDCSANSSLYKFICVATITMPDEPGKDFVSISLDHKSCIYGLFVEEFDTLKDRALIDDELVIHLKFTLCDPKLSSSWKETSSAKKLAEQSREETFANLGFLLESGDNSDFVIKVKSCDDEENVVEIKAHKIILGSRSQVFQRMLELEMTERSTGTMLIEDLSPACVKMMLKWMYTGVLDDGWKNIPEELVHAANKYGLTLLLNFLDQNLHFVCNLENAENLREAAKLHGLETATKHIVEFIAANIAFYVQKKV